MSIFGKKWEGEHSGTGRHGIGDVIRLLRSLPVDQHAEPTMAKERLVFAEQAAAAATQLAGRPNPPPGQVPPGPLPPPQLPRPKSAPPTTTDPTHNVRG